MPHLLPHPRRVIGALLAAVLATAAMFAFNAPAHAESQTATGGSLSWGVKSSFRSYVTGPVAQGAIAAVAPASFSSDAGSFPTASGTADATVPAVDAKFAGGLRFTGHHGALDLTFSNVRLVTSGSSGTLYVDYVGADLSGTPISGADVPLGSLSGVVYSNISATSITVDASSATLTAAGEPAFIGFYRAGDALDPLTATIALEAPVTATSTALSVNPTSPQAAGAAVTITATISPAAAGSVQFTDNGAPLGASAPVDSGTAQLQISSLGVGSHSLGAVFVSSDPAFAGSTASALDYAITAVDTAITPIVGTPSASAPQGVATDPAATSPVAAGAAVTFSATVGDGAAGVVQFLDNNAPLGAPVAITGGIAALTTTALAPGEHAITAAFIPTNPADFNPASSNDKLTYRIADGANAAVCTVGSGAAEVTGASATWAISGYLGSWPTRTVTGDVTVDGTTFTLGNGAGNATVDCTRIDFDGSFAITNTGRGNVAVVFDNPTLTIAGNGNGTLEADVSVTVPGAAPSGPTRVPVARFSGAALTPGAGGAVSFSVTPDYAGTVATGSFSSGYDAAFPAPFLLAIPSATRAYFHQTSATDKSPSPLGVGYSLTAIPTTTTLSPARSATAVLGSPTTFTATVAAAADATGTVDFLDGTAIIGTAPVTSGSAAFTTSSLAPGGHAIKAVYTPTGLFDRSESAPTAVGVVDPALPATCAVDADRALAVNGASASWPISAYVANWARTAAGNIAVDGSSFRLSGGTGTTDGSCTVLNFAGSFAIKNTGRGDVQFTYGNPTLVVSASGSGALIADVSASVPASGMGPATATGPTRVTVARFDGAAASTTPGGVVSFSVTPAYAGTVAAGSFAAGFDSAFPAPYLLAIPSTTRAYFHQSAANQDTKAPSALSATWTAPGPFQPVISFSTGSVEPGGAITITVANMAPGEKVSAEVHSEPVSLGTAVADHDGAVAFSWTVPADFELGEHTVTVAGLASGASASATFSVIAPTPVCIARTVSDGTMSWGVKAAFVSYVQGPIANGSASFTGWSGGSGTVNASAMLGTVSYRGSADFNGHGGLLQLTVANPKIQLTGPTNGLLLVDVTSKSLDSGAVSQQYGVAFASLALGAGSNNSTGDSIAYSGVPATLTASGAYAFSGFYGAGTALDPVSFTMPLGAQADCTPAIDPASGRSLASTGSDTVRPGLLGAVLVLIGAGLALGARRRFA